MVQLGMCSLMWVTTLLLSQQLVHAPFSTDDVDECQRQPNVCHNGGTCSNIQGGYSCVCVNGWTGESCQENIDDCPTAVCFNGATCHDHVASFFCECPMGKTGLLCHLEDVCVSNPCHKDAMCDTNPVSGRAICTCPPGFTGGACDKDVDECSIGANPCEHFGRCVNTHGSFQCQCGRGYTGPRCETDLNEYLSPLSNPLPTVSHRHVHSFTDACANNPCENGARCSNWNARYKCICLPGFKGRNCRVDINECRTPGLCQNGAQCQNTPGSFRCRCPSGYTGQFCEAIYVPCAPSQCLNGGTCRQTGELTYQCACLPGFKGVNCEINIDDCLGHKCRNGGTCVDGVNTYTCQCTPEWTGSEANECQRQPNVCHNGGTCINIQGGHFCVCVNGWTGESCSENIDDCATAACFNGATCHDRVASFFCECPVGKTGLLCHLEDACVRNPCHVNATCDTNPVNGRVICTCPPGFTGKACDQDVDECSIGVNPCKHFGRCVNTHGSFRCE